MVRALAMALRWRRLLDEGVCATIEELAGRERASRGYMSRVLRLTLLAPEIVEAIHDWRQPAALQLDELLRGGPLVWEEQRIVRTETNVEVAQKRTGGQAALLERDCPWCPRQPTASI